MRTDIAVIDWPDHQTVTNGVRVERVVDPMVDRLTDGDTILGWGGDQRLALYLAPMQGRWFLMRYNEDRTYGVVASWAGVPTSDIIGVCILHLLASDTRRRDVLAEVRRDNAKVKAEAEQRAQDWAEEEGGPMLAKALLDAADR